MGLEIKKEDSVLYLTINRPDKANSLDPTTLVNLRQEFQEAQNDPEIHYIVLSGSGKDNFTTGIDVKDALHLSEKNQINLSDIAGDISSLIYYGKPTIVAVNGRAMGMGIVFALASDYVLVIEDCHLQMPEIDSLIFPSANCISLMKRRGSSSWVNRVLMMGIPFTGQDATKANIVDEIIDHKEFEGRLNEIVELFKQKNYGILRAIKFANNNAYELFYDKLHELEIDLMNSGTWENPDTQLNLLTEKYDLGYTLHGKPDLLTKD